MTEPASVLDEIDEAAEERAIAEARADVAADRLVPHEEVARWLRSWYAADELPCPKMPSR